MKIKVNKNMLYRSFIAALLMGNASASFLIRFFKNKILYNFKGVFSSEQIEGVLKLLTQSNLVFGVVMVVFNWILLITLLLFWERILKQKDDQ